MHSAAARNMINTRRASAAISLAAAPALALASPSLWATRAFASKSGSPHAPASAASAAQMKQQASPASATAPRRNPKPAAAAASTPLQTRSPSLPTFNALMKRFNLLVHPDLFGSSPAQAHQNQQSLQALNSLLAGLKTRDPSDPYPPKQVLQLVFYIKKKRGDEAWVEFVRRNDVQMYLAGKTSPVGHYQNARKSVGGSGGRGGSSGRAGAATLPPRGHTTLENEFHIIPTLISTNGGQCKRSVQDQMASLFYRVGLPVKFKWDEEYWNMGGAKDQKFAEGEGAEGEEGEYEDEEWGTGSSSSSKGEDSKSKTK